MRPGGLWTYQEALHFGFQISAEDFALLLEDCRARGIDVPQWFEEQAIGRLRYLREQAQSKTKKSRRAKS
jgi:hypothetical protein